MLFGIPIRVDITFLVIALIGGFRTVPDIVAWTAAAFLAVLAHELGHALAARAFGVTQISVTLFALGGVTTYPAEPRLSPRRQLVVSAAGSAVGIALGGAAFFAGRAGLLDDADRFLRIFASSLVWVGAVLGLLNWLPIRPLDGGQMLTSALEIVTSRTRADLIATVVTVVVGATAAFAGFFVILITVMGVRSSETVRRATAQRKAARTAAATPPAGIDPSAAPSIPADDQEDFPI